jgi:hypothetical protein
MGSVSTWKVFIINLWIDYRGLGYVASSMKVVEYSWISFMTLDMSWVCRYYNVIFEGKRVLMEGML